MGPLQHRSLRDGGESPAPNTGRFCSRFFRPDAEWTDALSIPWRGETNGRFLAVSSHARRTWSARRASGAEGALIRPDAQWPSWWPLPREGADRTCDILRVQHLGAAEPALLVTRAALRLFGRGGVPAVRAGRTGRC